MTAQHLLGAIQSVLKSGPARQTFLLSNIQRLLTPSGRNKSSFLHDQAINNNSLVVAVYETWLHSGVLDAEVTHSMPGYNILRCDRSDRVGGGVALYLRDDLSGDVLGTFDNGVCQLLAVQVHQLDTILAVAYRPPDTRLEEFKPMLNKLDDILTDLPSPTPIITLMGDFNLRKETIQWICSDEGLLIPALGGRDCWGQAGQILYSPMTVTL